MLLSEKFSYLFIFRQQVTSVLIPIPMLVLKSTPTIQKVRNKELFPFAHLKQSHMLLAFLIYKQLGYCLCRHGPAHKILVHG